MVTQVVNFTLNVTITFVSGLQIQRLQLFLNYLTSKNIPKKTKDYLR